MPALKGADIPPGNWARDPRRMPLSSRLCPGCGTLMAQALVDIGYTCHVTCDPPRNLRLVRSSR